MGITKSIIKRIFKPTVESIVENWIDGDFNYSSLQRQIGLSRLAKVCQHLWRSRIATLVGKIHGERDGARDRQRIGGVGSTLATNQYFSKSDITDSLIGADDQDFTVRVVCNPSSSIADGDIVASWMDSSPAEGAQIRVAADAILFEVKRGDGTTISADFGLTLAEVKANGKLDLVGVYDDSADEIYAFLNGRLVDAVACVGYTAPTQSKIAMGSQAESLGTATFEGELFEAQIWNSTALTDRQIISLFDNDISQFQSANVPSLAWLFDGDRCIDLTGGNNHLTPAQSPTAYRGKDGCGWYDEQGWNHGNIARLVHDRNIGDVFKFRFKGSPDQFIFLNNLYGSNFAGYGTSSTSDAFQHASSITVDGSPLVDIAGSSIAFKTATFDNAEHDVEITMGASFTGWAAVDIGDFANFSAIYSLDAGEYVRLISVNDQAPVFDLDNSQLSPKQWGANLDSDGASAINSNSFGPAKNPAQLVDGSCVDFDGNNQYGTIANHADYTFGDGSSDSPFSILIQHNGDSFSGDGGGLVGKAPNSTTGNIEYELYTDASGNIVFLLADDTLNNFIRSVTDVGLTSGIDYKILATYDGSGSESGLTIYVKSPTDDGFVEVAQTRSLTGSYTAMHSTSSPVELGVFLRSSGDDRWTDGTLCDFRLYDSEIIPADVDDISLMSRWFTMAEESGGECYCKITGEVMSLEQLPARGTQDIFHPNESLGYDAIGTFDAVNDFVELANNTILDAVTNSTISTWIKTTDNSGGVIGKWTGGLGCMIYLTSGLPNFYIDNDGSSCRATTNISDGDWHHIAVTLNGSEAKIYIDGNLEDTATMGTPSSNTAKFCIGCYASGTEPVGGVQTESRVYDRALIAAEVTYEYTRGVSGVDPTRDGLVGEWIINDGKGLVVADTSDSGFNGAIVGATSDEFWAVKVPSKSDGTSLIRTTLSHPPRVGHNGSQSKVKFEGDQPNATFLARTHTGAEFDGTAFIEVDDAASQFDVDTDHAGIVWFKASQTSSGACILGSTIDATNRFGIYLVSNEISVSAYNGTMASKSSPFSDTESWHKLEWEYATATHSLTVLLDGISITSTVDAAVAIGVGTNIGAQSDEANKFQGQIQNLVVANGSNWALLKDSHDRSEIATPVHGDDTNVTYPIIDLTNSSNYFEADDVLKSPQSVTNNANLITFCG